MNRNIIILFLLTCLFITACGNEDEPNAVSPINFEKRDYTVMFGKRTVIPFIGGSGGYELTASNPEILGRFGIEMEDSGHRLYIQPAKTGESYLTIKDVKAEATVTLHFIVEDYYLSFRIDEIEGANTNEFFEVGRELRFIRNEDNTRPVKVIWYNNMTFQPMIVGEGIFNISHSGTYLYTMEFSLHHKSDEEFALYEYTMGGDDEYMTMFDSIFNFDWEKNIASLSSRSQPVKRIEMILTDKSNGCKVTCSFQQ